MDATATPDANEARVKAGWAKANIFPLWENPAAHAKPRGPEEPYCWRWSDVSRFAAEASGLRNMAAVERRVLQLVTPNSHLPDQLSGSTTNLNGNVQILLPGETARPHRHSMNALRFVLEGEGAVTIVDGKECLMEKGDLVTTPGWTWHEHAHRGTKPIIWLDVLDASIHRYLGTDKFQPGPANDIPAHAPDSAFVAAGMAPVIANASRSFSPLFRYPWAQAKAAVSAAPVDVDGARRVRYANPIDGGPCMSFLDCYLVELDNGVETLPFRTTAHSLATIVEGEGVSRVGARTTCSRCRITTGFRTRRKAVRRA
jgi:gentisate 1,2-dioxygenase